MSKTSRHRKKENHLSSYKGLIFRGNSNPHRHLLKTTRILGSALFFLLFSVIVVNLFFAKSASAAEQSAKAVATDCLKIKGAYFYATLSGKNNTNGESIDIKKDSDLKKLDELGDKMVKTYTCTNYSQESSPKLCLKEAGIPISVNECTNLTKKENLSEISKYISTVLNVVKAYKLCVDDLGGKWDSESGSGHNLNDGGAGGCHIPKAKISLKECEKGNGIEPLSDEDGKLKECKVFSNGRYVGKKGVGSIDDFIKFMKGLLGANGQSSQDLCTQIAKNDPKGGWHYVPSSSGSAGGCYDKSGNLAGKDQSDSALKDLNTIKNNGDNDASSSCNVGGIGWVVCPIVSAVGMAAQGFWGLIEPMLKVNISFFSDVNAITARDQFLVYANVLLAIIFIVVIYSEATGNGFGALNNYTVKKSLPKLVIFAALINMSWYICAGIVDISNIFGSGLYEFFKSMPVTNNGISDFGQIMESIGAIGTLVMAGAGSIVVGTIVVAVAAGGIGVGWAAIILVFVLLIVCVCFMIMIWLILSFRIAAIFMLVILSPIAFALGILPNTQKLFSKWRKTFTSLLIVYPVIAFVFGASSWMAVLYANVFAGGSIMGMVLLQSFPKNLF